MKNILHLKSSLHRLINFLFYFIFFLFGFVLGGGNYEKLLQVFISIFN